MAEGGTGVEGPLLLLLLLLLTMSRAQQFNRPPEFLQGGDMNGFTLREDTAVGSVVYTLKGQDPEGTDVSFTVSGDHLSVDRDTGLVTLVQPLDRETISSIEAIITVTDERVFGIEANTVPIRREIPFIDVNDNRPLFHNDPYTFSVAESASPGATLYSTIKITDADSGSNADVKLECIKEETPKACEKFEVREARVAEGEYVGIISLRELLDYETHSEYSIAMRARDSGREIALSATTTVKVDVRDVQDQPPVFLNAPFTATVREASPPGTPVVEVQARDGDLGEPRRLTLTLEGDDAGYFRLGEAKSGQDDVMAATIMTSNMTLDRENPIILNNGGLYTFYIRAQEEAGEAAVAQVTVVVTDVDDQRPVFSHDHINVQVPEDIADGTPLPGLNLVVSDGDVGENARFTLALEDIFASQGTFSIFPEAAVGRSPVVVKVARADRLDYENPEASNFVFKVVASEKGIPVASAVVNVTVTDANDNSPTFPQASYRFSVSEGVTHGHAVTTLLANDSDSGQYGQLSYSLKGFGAEKFRVDETMGKLYIVDCGSNPCLDFERQQTFSLTYSATDGGGKVTSVNIFIDVEDENDNAPVFSRREYRRTVDEGASAFDPPLFVKATDADGESQGGGRVFYKIQEGNTEDEAFFMEPVSGELTIQRALTHLDTPSSTYALTIRATDAGEPPKHTDVRIFVTVGRDTNRPPRFRQRGYKAKVPEDAPPGTEVIQVVATDPDGSDEALVYLLTAGARDNFVINDTSGQVTVASGASLNRDLTPMYQLVVAAVDSGEQTRQTSTTTIIVDLEDVNNKPPKFDQESYVQYVSERLPVDEVVVRVRASDPDLDAELRYFLTPPIMARDKTGVALKPSSPYDYMGTFSINETSGEVYVSGVLDHNEAAVVILTITVTDMNASEDFPNQNDTAEVTLYVQAFSAQNPIFAPPWTPARPQLQVEVEEEQDPGTVVFSVTARDPVTGQPVRRYEKVGGSDPEDLFTVAPITGLVTVNARLDYEASETKTTSLQVLAIAGDRSSQASVTVKILDVNDNSPIFTENEYHTRLSEDSRFPKSVLMVTATDADTGPRGEVKYSLGGEGALLFVINETNGEIVIARGAQLDREASASITLEVTAYDTPGGGVTRRKTTVIVEVELVDVNDESPVWREDGGGNTVVVAENTGVGSPVATLLASDPDLGLNGLVRYQLPEPQGQLDGHFSLDDESGVLSVKAALNGKGRTEPYELTIRALDQGTPQQYSESTLRILIGDVSANDGVPSFIRPAPNEGASVLENSKVGTAVFQVEAEDPDDPNTPNGKIVYSFLDDGSNNGVFEIDPTTGMIRTAGTVDREVREQYTVVVVAQDLGRPPQLASRVITINITDTDDNPPIFPRLPGDEAMEVEVEEEAAVGTVVGHVSAQDMDSGDNAFIDYRITFGNDGGLFGINRTSDNRGMIYVKNRIDREEVDSVTLTLLCGKLGRRMPTRMEYDRANPAMMQMLILVRDLDDNKPSFERAELTAGVRVDAALQTEVVRLRAYDKDPTAQPIRYAVHNISFSHLEDTVELLPDEEVDAEGTLLLEGTTGALRTNAPLTRYAHGTFTVFITAASAPPPATPAMAKVTIYVLRDSDLMRFVFGLTPGEVRRQLANFRKEVEGALPVAASLNIYDTTYYSNADGAIDFTTTGSCFQLEGRNLHDTKVLLDARQNPDLDKVFNRFTVRKVERCVPRRASTGADWVEVWVLVIAAFIGVGGGVAAITVCCLYSSYRRRLKQHHRHLRLLESPPSVGPVLPPGSIVMLPPGPLGHPGPPGPPMGHLGPPPGPPGHPIPPPASMLSSEPPRSYEWQERGLPMDNVSYRSGQR